MSVQDFIFKIGADITQFEKSITDVSNELDTWKEKLKTATGAGIVEANKNIDLLTKSIDRLKKQGFQDLEKKTAGAQNALFSITQVARDLPFGFVAIQNNLPLVFDQFSRLTQESGGLIKGLKNLGVALIGPAGFTFAISVAISSITNLVQQYGSLGNAFKALTGQTLSATDIQNKYNKASEDAIKNTEAEKANLQSLISVLTNTNNTREQQEGAFTRINKEYPGFLANLQKEQIFSGNLNTILASRLKLFTKQIELEGRKDALVKLISEASVQGEKALKNIENFADITVFDQIGLQFKGLLQGLTGANAGLLVLSNELKTTKQETDSYSKTLLNVNTELSGIDTQINELIKSQQQQLQGLKDQANENERLKKQKISDEITRQKNAWKFIGQEVNEYYQTLKNILASNDRIAKTKADIQQKQAAQNTKKALEDQKKAALDAEAAFFALADAEMATGETAVKNPLAGLETLAPDLQKYTNFQNVLAGLTDTFFNPLTSLFENFLTTGKFTFQDFAKTVLATVKRLVAQLIATGILRLLASILVPGGAQAGAALSGAAKATKGIGGFLKGVLGGFLGGGIAAPQFGGVQAGALSMGGQVNLTLRGADLVGSINRTNTIINRIG